MRQPRRSDPGSYAARQVEAGTHPGLEASRRIGASELPAVEALLNADSSLRVFVQDRHGIFSFANSIELARYNAELVEETAQIAWNLALSERLALKRERDA